MEPNQNRLLVFVAAAGTTALIASGIYFYFLKDKTVKVSNKKTTQQKDDVSTSKTVHSVATESVTPLSASTNNYTGHRSILTSEKTSSGKSLGSRRRTDEQLIAEELYSAGRKKDSYPEGKVSPKESRDPSKRGIQLKNYGSATYRNFLANAKPQQKIYQKTLKLDELEKVASDDKIFRKTLDHIGQVLLSKSKSIRKIFRRLDKNFYGYLTVEAFRKVLDEPGLGLQELTTEEKDTIVKYCDCADGKIDYKEFFHYIF